MITKGQMQAAGFVPITYGKYAGSGWTKTLYDENGVVVEIYYAPGNGFVIGISGDDIAKDVDIPLNKSGISFIDCVEWE